MMKLLLLTAVLANVILLVASGSSSSSQSSSSSSSSSESKSWSSESSSSSSSYSSSSATDTESGECTDDVDGDGSVDQKKCGANETYLECPEAQCVPRQCSELGMPISCPDQPQDGSCPGKPGCVCIDGFVRDENNVCIPSSDCPSCGGDKNKRAGCGVYCNQHCSDIDAKDPKACIEICYFNACDCRPGFYLNSKGDCVKPDQCDVKKCGANETYLECPEAQCVPRQCSELGMPISCPDQPQDGSCPGKPGCVCIDGFVRDENNVCIPSSDCPSCGGDKNKRAGCGVYCNQHCSDIDAEGPKACIAICYFNACDCRPGFYLNSKGDCVKPNQCDVTPTCKKNEVFSDCTNGGCDARNCSQLGNPVPCVRLDPEECKKGCICIDGYLRAKNGTCVPKTQCPCCGGDPNAKAGCGVNCGKRCSTYKSKSPICPKICKVNGCDCKDKYVFDDNLGKCVLPKDCTPTCKKNEVFSDCTNGGCDARNCSQLGNPVPCVKLSPAACKKGCICIDGYLRAENGTCIPKTQCPSCGGDPNAESGCGVNCGKRCSTYKIKSPICPLICNVNGCDCKDKYVFDDNLGKCVLPKDCTPSCKKNEVFSNCTNGGCDARNCSQLGNPVPCIKLPPSACKKGCICIDGYLRAENGTCVPKTQCPSCGGDPNAESGCGVNCGKRCSTYKIKSPICPLICNVNGCDCKDKYVFDDNLGKCVLPKDCTPTCKKNEVFSNCTNGGCDARNCSQLGNPVPCVKLDPAACKKGCICIDGYLRAENGTCIPKTQCPSCGGDPNAESGCGVNCGKRCSTYKIKSPICPRICNVNGCDCKDKYVFDDNIGKCVLPKDCTPSCQINEIFSNCTNSGCDATTCSQLGYPVPCVDIDPSSCKKGCVCIQDYVRAKNGTCIPKNECPSCGGDPNAKSGCSNHCGNSCSTYKRPVPCPYFCLVNGCDCKENYVYDNNLQKCVLPKDCTPTCQVNEVFSNCTNSGCDARNCSQLGYPVPCVDPVSCKKGCICKQDYLRAKNGTCIPRNECPPTCQINEIFSNCTNSGCDATTCSQLGYPVPCVDIDPSSCKKGCVCIQDYVRAKNGTCIPKNECPSCGGDPNAKSGCSNHCGNSCSTYKRPVPCPYFCLVNGCDCKENYVYDNNLQKCVLPKDCTPTCQVNEVFSNCTNSGCDARNCSQLGYPVPCVDPVSCKKGCICKQDYLRAKNGTCIPRNECPSCGGDPNAKPGCGVHCGNTCSTYKNKPVACPLICQLNGCDCKTNYVYDTNTKKCVLPKDCTPTCPLHEVYISCANVACVARNCSQYGKPMPDHCVPPRKCIGGCVCEKGYLRATDGTCIPQEQCCKSSTTTTTTTTTTVAPSTGQCSDGDAQEYLTSGNVDFTLNFLYEMIKLNSGKSIVMSPFSVFIPLAELALCTEPGDSYNQLMDALNLNTKDQIRSVFPVLLSSLKSQQDAILDLAAKIYVNKDAQLTPNFENDSLQIFGAKAENVDFSDAEKAADIINAWVEEVTRGLIQNLVSPSMFSAYTRLVLVNAIYFLGNWQTQFNPNNTQTEDFHVTSDKTVQVPMMYRKGSFKYAESSILDCKILEIPYKGGNFSYVIFLPNEVDGNSALAEKIKDPAVLNQALDSMSYQTCLLYLPRHDITSSIDLKTILQALNITGIFNSNTANLSGIIEGNEELFVSSGIQKANIKVNEVGTEAAAANALVVGTTSVVQPQTIYTVKADHPFLFFLFLKRNPLFCGAYAGN